MNFLYLKAASAYRDSLFVKPNDKPSSFSTNLTRHKEWPFKTSSTTRKSASNDQKNQPMTSAAPAISCFVGWVPLLSSEQKIPRGLEPRGPGSHSCGRVPVQVTKNRPVRMDTAYPGLLEPGHGLLQENPWILSFIGRKFII